MMKSYKIFVCVLLFRVLLINCQQYSVEDLSNPFTEKIYVNYLTSEYSCQVGYTLKIKDNLKLGYTLVEPNQTSYSSVYASDSEYWLGKVIFNIDVSKTFDLVLKITDGAMNISFVPFKSFYCESEPYPLTLLKPNLTFHESMSGLYTLYLQFNITKTLSLSSVVIAGDSNLRCAYKQLNFQIFVLECLIVSRLPIAQDSLVINVSDFQKRITNFTVPYILPNSVTNNSEILNPTIEIFPKTSSVYPLEPFSYVIDVYNPENRPLYGFTSSIFLIPMVHGSTKGNKTYYLSQMFLMNVSVSSFYYVLNNPQLLPDYLVSVKETLPNPYSYDTIVFERKSDQLNIGQGTFSTLNGLNFQRVGFSFGNGYTDSFNEFPNGILSGCLNNATQGFTYIVPKFNYSNGIYSTYIPSGFTEMDSIKPLITSLEWKIITNDKVYIKLRAGDNLSGFRKLVMDQTGTLSIESRDISQGTILDGQFEKIITVSNLVLPVLQLWDYAGQYSSISSQYFGFNSYQPLPFHLPQTNPPTFFLSEAYFALNDLNLTLVGAENTFYFNYPNPNKGLMFILKIQEGKKYFSGKWNEKEQKFSVDFTLPPRPAVFSSIYYRVLASNFQIDSPAIIHMVGESGDLRFQSEWTDLLPPLVTEIEVYPSDIVQINQDGIKISWNLRISDELNGFLEGKISVSSDIDGLDANFTLSPSSDNNIYNDVYSIGITIPRDCKTQTFYIRYIELTDQGDNTGYDIYGGRSSPYSPLLKLSESDLKNITIQCPEPETPDTTSPVLSSYNIDAPLLLDVSSESRSFTIIFNTTDSDSPISIRHTPYCYLTEILYRQYRVQATLQRSSLDGKNVEWLCKILTPYGFGFPNDAIAISIHGYADTRLNFGGMGVMDLTNAGLRAVLEIEFPRTYPIIEETSTITTKGGQITLIGRNFGTDDNETVVKVQYYNDPKIYYPNISWRSNILLIVDDILPNQYSFNISVLKDDKESSPLPIKVEDGVLTPPCKSSGEGEPLCGGPSNGICTKNGCKCNDKWMGLDCLSQPILQPNNPPIITETSPEFSNDIILEDEDNSTGENNNEQQPGKITLKSLVSIISLDEIKFDGTLIKSHPLTIWEFKNITDNGSNTQEYNYKTSILNNNVSTDIIVTLKVFKQEQQISFAYQKFNMLPSSIKYNVEISSYGFTSSSSYLHLVMSASLKKQSNSDISLSTSCSYQESGTSNEENFPDFIKLQIDDHSLYGRFIKRGIIDNRVQSISNIVRDQSTNSSIESKQEISIKIPHFIQSAILDPDFSLLIDSRPASDNPKSVCSYNQSANESTKSGLSKTQLIGIIIGSIAFATAICVVVGYFIYKKRQESLFMNSFNNKLKSKS